MSDLGGIAATPELLAAVDALPPATDVPAPPGRGPHRPGSPASGSSGCCAPSAALLALTILLVGLDAPTTLAFPTVARYAVDARDHRGRSRAAADRGAARARDRRA